MIDAPISCSYRLRVRLKSAAAIAAVLVLVLACRTVWAMVAVGLADSGHGVTIGWQSGRSTLVLLHDAEHALPAHHHGSADRLLLVADDHAEESPHHVAAFAEEETAVSSRGNIESAPTIWVVSSIASGSSGLALYGAVSHIPRPPPAPAPRLALLRTTILRI